MLKIKKKHKTMHIYIAGHGGAHLLSQHSGDPGKNDWHRLEVILGSIKNTMSSQTGLHSKIVSKITEKGRKREENKFKSPSNISNKYNKSKQQTQAQISPVLKNRKEEQGTLWRLKQEDDCELKAKRGYRVRPS